jgi:predicted P-loop ATPase
MMIVIGPQGTGKTSMPAIMFKGNCLTLYGEHNDKDLHMLLHSALVVGFDELDSFGKREASNLKAMITRNEDAFRPPYGASVEVFPRRFTLYGCGNRYEFLQNDPSGYRRYAIIEVNKLLDFAGLEAVRDHLWAEAWARYSRGGVRYWEISGASANAERYVIPNVLEDQIQNWLWAQAENKNGTNCKDGYVYFTMSQLLMGVNHEGAAKNPHVTRDIAATLRKLGCEQRNTSKEVAPGVRGRHYVWAVSQT